MPPKRKAEKKGPEPTAAEPAAKPSSFSIDRPFQCGECQRLRVQHPKGWLPWKCGACGLPVWFTTRQERNEYATRSETYCCTCNSDPCSCANRAAVAAPDQDQDLF